jgi:hypothetical protein
MNMKRLGTMMPAVLLLAACSDMPTAAPDLVGPAGLEFYVAPPGDIVVYGTEQGSDKGDLWAVNLTQGTTHLMYDWADPSGDRNSPNAVAFDAANGRMYFSVNTNDTGGGSAGDPDELYMFNVATPAVAPVLVGVLPQTAYSADFYASGYYYIPNVTSDLIRVDFDAAGFPTGATTLCTSFRRPDLAGTNRENRLYFGDIAIKDGIVYGSAMVNNERDKVKFFKLTLGTCAYEEWQAVEESMLQLAWGADGVLYGHETETGLFYVVNPNDGSRSAGPTYSPAGLKLTDIAPATLTTIPTGTCEGGVNKIVVKYIGADPLAGVVRGQRRNPQQSAILDAIVTGAGDAARYTFATTEMGGQFTSVAAGRIANNFRIFIGTTLIADFHTSCSAPIYPGMQLGVGGVFEITEVYSVKGGMIGAP